MELPLGGHVSNRVTEAQSCQSLFHPVGDEHLLGV